LEELFDWLVQPTLLQVKKSDLFVPFSELHLVNCMLRLLDEIFGKLNYEQMLCKPSVQKCFFARN